MNQGIKVAVLDDGIFQGKYCLPSLQWNIKMQNGILEDPYQSSQPHRVTSHGTVCAAIIHHYAPRVGTAEQCKSHLWRTADRKSR